MPQSPASFFCKITRLNGPKHAVCTNPSAALKVLSLTCSVRSCGHRATGDSELMQRGSQRLFLYDATWLNPFCSSGQRGRWCPSQKERCRASLGWDNTGTQEAPVVPLGLCTQVRQWQQSWPGPCNFPNQPQMECREEHQAKPALCSYFQSCPGFHILNSLKCALHYLLKNDQIFMLLRLETLSGGIR